MLGHFRKQFSSSLLNSIKMSYYFAAGVQTSSTETVWVVLGGSVSLPCDIRPDDPLEQVATVLWYRQGRGEPIYTWVQVVVNSKGPFRLPYKTMWHHSCNSFFTQNISQMDLSGVYTVCVTFSLLWETKIVHTKLGKNIKKLDITFTICSMDQMDIYTKYTNGCVTDYFLLSATWCHVVDITRFCKAV